MSALLYVWPWLRRERWQACILDTPFDLPFVVTGISADWFGGFDA